MVGKALWNVQQHMEFVGCDGREPAAGGTQAERRCLLTSEEVSNDRHPDQRRSRNSPNMGEP